MRTFSKTQILDVLKDFILINLGMAVYSLGWAAFLLPYHITTGGMAGMAAILQYATSIPMQYTIFVVNAFLLALALWQLGWRFTLKTGYAVLALSTYLQLGQDLMTQDGQLLQVLGEGQDSMACVLGAILNGAGIGIVFLTGGSTGGWDIVAALVNKFRPNISLGRVLLFLDFFVIASCWPIFHDLRMVVFGYITLAVYTYVLDLLMNSTRQDVQFLIISRKHEAISERIISETNHSVTVLDGEGYYSHTGVKVMIIIVHKREQIKILRLIHEADPHAFLSQSRVEGVYGQGFTIFRP